MIAEENIDKIVRNIVKNYKPERIILFGSMARRDNTRDSDIDLLVVSKAFEKYGFIKRASLMYKYWSFRHPVDFICYTPEEFRKRSKGVTIVSQALKEGIEIT